LQQVITAIVEDKAITVPEVVDSIESEVLRNKGSSPRKLAAAGQSGKKKSSELRPTDELANILQMKIKVMARPTIIEELKKIRLWHESLTGKSTRDLREILLARLEMDEIY
jgi:hypothetical protein